MYCLNPYDTEPIFLVDEQIGYDKECPENKYIDGSDFSRELLDMDSQGKKRIQIWICSFGGNVDDALKIYSAMMKTKTKVDTYNTGVACSSAAILFQGGRKRIMMDFAKLMFHQVSGGGTEGQKAITDSLITIICARSGKAYEDVAQMMSRETWIGAEEALELGLCDEIEYSSELNKPRLSGEIKAMYSQGLVYTNNALKIKTSKMKSIANKLGLKDDASEEEMMNALTTLLNGRVLSNTGDEQMTNKLSEQLTEMVNKALAPVLETNTALQTELKNIKDASELAKAETTSVQATALVNKYINKIGGTAVKEDVKNSWIDKAKADLKGTETLLESIPVNVIAPDFTNAGNPDTIVVPYTAEMINMGLTNAQRNKFK
jgi:ATP-dependent protease ClpP protease subunit